MRNWANKEELDEIQRLTLEPPQSWEEYETSAVRVGELVARMNGCQCLADIREQYRLVVANFRQASSGDLNLLQDVKHPSHQKHWKLNISLAKKLARERRCHALMRGFVCYCDEHSH